MSSPQWLNELLGVNAPTEGASVTAHGHRITTVAGIPRSAEFVSAAQEQTRETFGFKWAKRDTFEGSVADHMRNWLVQKYGDVPHAPWFSKITARTRSFWMPAVARRCLALRFLVQ